MSTAQWPCESPWRDPDLYRWQGRLKREGLTATLRLELRELLAVKLVLKKPFRWGDDDSSSTDEPTRIKQLADWELALAADHVHSALRDLADEPWKSAFPYLLEDFSSCCVMHWIYCGSWAKPTNVATARTDLPSIYAPLAEPGFPRLG